METNQPKPYDQAREEAFADHVANSGGRSEYMQVDFDAGFSAGYNAAMNNVALRKRDEALRERAAIAAMQGLLAHGTATCSSDFIAGRAVDLGNALVNQLNTEQS